MGCNSGLIQQMAKLWYLVVLPAIACSGLVFDQTHRPAPDRDAAAWNGETGPVPDPDPCQGITCDPGQVCAEGLCVPDRQDEDEDDFAAANDCDDHDATVFPGATRPCSSACGAGETTCHADGTWSPCSPLDECDCVEEGECDPSIADQPCATDCGTVGLRSCGGDCTWGACRPPNEADGATCHDGVDNDCDGDPDCDDPDCVGLAGGCTCRNGTTRTQPCGNCGTATQSCSQGEWGSLGPCTDEGSCTAGDEETRSCGACREESKICENDCRWGRWGSCEPIDHCQPACGGTEVFGHCWYLTNAGDSCLNYCSRHGGYDSATEEIVGTESQGGSRSQCEDLFHALGYRGSVSSGTHSSGLGVGCNLWTTYDSLWWCRYPALNPAVGRERLRMICACNN